MIKLLNMDCMEMMKEFPDNHFELAIVDPPYGIERFKKGSLRFDSSDKTKDGLQWDSKPPLEYFDELIRVSHHQIIWGANNFSLPATEYFCIWDKKQTVDNFATAEYAYVSMSLKSPAKIFHYSIHQHNSDHSGGYKIHPTQKPVKLYEWLLTNYAKKGDKIVDTHGGSMSSAIACHNMGFDLVLSELDEDYYKAGVERYEQHIKQGRLF